MNARADPPSETCEACPKCGFAYDESEFGDDESQIRIDSILETRHANYLHALIADRTKERDQAMAERDEAVYYLVVQTGALGYMAANVSIGKAVEFRNRPEMWKAFERHNEKVRRDLERKEG